MIAISSASSDRKTQAEDARTLVKILKSSEEDKIGFIEEFSKKYSTIAAERVLNYHYEECLEIFLSELKGKQPFDKLESITESFTSQFGFHEKTMEKLFERIEWNYHEFDLTKINQMPQSFQNNQKFRHNLIKIIKSKLAVAFENKESVHLIKVQVIPFVSADEFELFLNEQHLIHISNNIYSTLIDKNTALIEEFNGLLSKQAQLHEVIMGNVINSIKNGLLNIGNSTSEILFHLKELIPLLRSIDKSGFVLDSCLKETKIYFKQFRKDLNSALLQFLLENKNEDFCFAEDQKDKNNPFALEYPPKPNDDWQPDPVYIKSFINPEIRTANPINLLISQLSTNSSTSLAENYQKQLAERLLKVEHLSEIERIVEEVEIIRTKCGELFVNGLNIMINDVIESRNKATKNKLKVTIISHRYWPEFPEKDLEHPEFIAEDLITVKETYSRQFEDKRIVWRPQMDEVKVSLEFPSGTFNFSCPIEAAIFINSFEFPEEEEFDLKMATAMTGISDKNILKLAINFWLKKRVLLACKGYCFKFAQDYDPNEDDCVDSLMTLFSNEDAAFVDEEEDSGSTQEIFNQFQQKYWPIIANMLKTFGQISAERIQSTLKMYSKEYKEPQDLLVKFLQHRVKEGILQSAGNRIVLYSLVNK